MKKKYIIGNWKSHKTSVEVEKWFVESSKLCEKEKRNITNDTTIILCPPFLYLSQVSILCKKYALPIKLGTQDISPFGTGAYTGEIAASQVREFAEYVIIGHSERRTYFGEDETLLAQKIEQARKANLIPIYCIQDATTPIPQDVPFVAYEPVSAIGTGNAQTPATVNEVAQEVRKKREIDTFIYGGSVTADNIESFLTFPEIDGVLPGSASLTATAFWEMIHNASHI